MGLKPRRVPALVRTTLYSHLASEQEYLIIRGRRQGAGGRRREKN